MIKLIDKGKYKLFETKDKNKILVLSKNTFAWIDVPEIGEILVKSIKTHEAKQVLSIGEYKLYQVKDESKLVDLEHLELNVGENIWQGYLLPTGLPSIDDRRNRIIPTEEVITKS